MKIKNKKVKNVGLKELEDYIENKRFLKDKECVEIPREYITISCRQGLVFNDYQVLHIDKKRERYKVGTTLLKSGNYADVFVLVPCVWDDLEPKDIAFRTNKEAPDFTKLRNYCKIINNRKYAYIKARKHVREEYNKDFDWWKMVNKSEVKDKCIVRVIDF